MELYIKYSNLILHSIEVSLLPKVDFPLDWFLSFGAYLTNDQENLVVTQAW